MSELQELSDPSPSTGPGTLLLGDSGPQGRSPKERTGEAQSPHGDKYPATDSLSGLE